MAARATANSYKRIPTKRELEPILNNVQHSIRGFKMQQSHAHASDQLFRKTYMYYKLGMARLILLTHA